MPLVDCAYTSNTYSLATHAYTHTSTVYLSLCPQLLCTCLLFTSAYHIPCALRQHVNKHMPPISIHHRYACNRHLSNGSVFLNRRCPSILDSLSLNDICYMLEHSDCCMRLTPHFAASDQGYSPPAAFGENLSRKLCPLVLGVRGFVGCTLRGQWATCRTA